MTPRVCEHCGGIHAAHHPTGERACRAPSYPRMGLVLIALLLCLAALYIGTAVGRWIA